MAAPGKGEVSKTVLIAGDRNVWVLAFSDERCGLETWLERTEKERSEDALSRPLFQCRYEVGDCFGQAIGAKRYFTRRSFMSSKALLLSISGVAALAVHK